MELLMMWILDMIWPAKQQKYVFCQFYLVIKLNLEAKKPMRDTYLKFIYIVCHRSKYGVLGTFYTYN